MPVVFHVEAENDTNAALDSYRSAAVQVALDFVDAIEDAVSRIADRPELGSPHLAQELGLPGLRCSLATRFPYLIFYVVVDDTIDVWRVLHAHRDIPESLRDPD